MFLSSTMGPYLPAALVCIASTGACYLSHETGEHAFAEANVTIAILVVILFLTLIFEVGRHFTVV